MRNWHQFVAERLARLQLPDDGHDVIAEIAEHLEDCEADQQEAMTQVTDWSQFGQNIRRAKEVRMSFARRVVIPGVVAVILALAALRVWVYLLVAPQPCGPDVTCIRVSADGPAYVPWLAVLPFIGALAAALARRAGARPWQRLVAAVFPALYLALEMGAWAVIDQFYWRIPVYWVIIPAIVIAIGAWPFVGGHLPWARRSSAANTIDSSERRGATERRLVEATAQR
jgi:hypothetical protein